MDQDNDALFFLHEAHEKAFQRHTQDGFQCVDPNCMFPAQVDTWCTLKVR